MFGHIDDIKIGDTFVSRKAVSERRLHGPIQAGIWGTDRGAYSIVLSDGYEDDIDALNYIYYTGHGGRNDKGVQIADQEFTVNNRGLQLSCQYKLPVRVIRGYQTQYGPKTGYRYDGLYYVESYERVIGKSGFYICSFHLTSENSIEQLERALAPSLKTSYVRPKRVQITSHRLQRNIKISEKVKKEYSFRCQVCNVLLGSPVGPIAIGAHIKGLGAPHNGPDIIENMLCLCPNHHDQLDCRSYYIEPDTKEIIGLDGFKGKKLHIHSKHKIEKQFLEYQKTEFLKIRNKA